MLVKVLQELNKLNGYLNIVKQAAGIHAILLDTERLDIEFELLCKIQKDNPEEFDCYSDSYSDFESGYGVQHSLTLVMKKISKKISLKEQELDIIYNYINPKGRLLEKEQVKMVAKYIDPDTYNYLI